MSKNVRRGRSGIGSVCVLGIVCVIATTAPIIPADAASQVEVSASTNFEVESVVAGSNPTIVLNGSGLPEVPAGDIGQATDTPYLLVTDSTGFLGSWNAGYTGDGCTVTIGESTATTMVFRVNAPSVSCPDSRSPQVTPSRSRSLTDRATSCPRSGRLPWHLLASSPRSPASTLPTGHKGEAPLSPIPVAEQ